MKRLQRMMNRWMILYLLLCLLPISNVFSIKSLASEVNSQIENMQEIREDIFTPFIIEDDHSGEELYELYADQVFYGNTVSSYRRLAGDMLVGDEKLLYDALVPYIRQIADGERASSIITVGQEVRDNYGVLHHVDTKVIFKESTFTQDMFNRVIEALLADFPYEC